MAKPLNIIKEHLKQNLKAGESFQMQIPVALESKQGRPVEGTPWIEFDFRLLTGRYLGESGYFLDFATPGVLENALPLFRIKSDGGVREKPLKYQRNHSYRIEDTLGYSQSVAFGHEGDVGQITSVARLHKTLAEKEIEMLTTDPPLLESVSLALNYNWVQSHPEMRFWQFIDLLGHEVDGEIVRIVVTEILEVYHIGLVWNGADEQAVRLNATHLWNEHSGDFNALFTKEELQNPSINIEGEKVMETLLEKIMKALGIDKEDQLESRIASLMSEAAQVEGLNTQVADLTTLNAELTQTIADLNVQIEADKPNVEMGKKYIENLKKDVKGLAGLVMGNLSESMQELIESASPEKLESLRTEFEEKADSMFPARCQDCGSSNVSLRSSRENTEPPKPKNEIDLQKFSLRDLNKK